MVSRAFNQGFWLLSFIEKQLNKYLDTLNCMNLFFLCLPQLAHANVHPAGWVRRGLQVSSRTPRSSLTPHRFPMVSHRGPQLSDMGRRVKIGYQICCCRIYFGCISVSLGLTVILNHTVPICWRGQTVKLIICVSLGRTDWLAIFCIHLMGYGSLGYMFFIRTLPYGNQSPFVSLCYSGWWFGTFWYIFPIILGMSSSQLLLTPWFFRGVGQPPTSDEICGGETLTPPTQSCSRFAAASLGVENMLGTCPNYRYYRLHWLDVSAGEMDVDGYGKHYLNMNHWHHESLLNTFGIFLSVFSKNCDNFHQFL